MQGAVTGKRRDEAICGQLAPWTGMVVLRWQ